MGALRKVAAAVLILSFAVFIALFGRLPALRKTPIGLFHRLLFIALPGLLRRLDVDVFGGRLAPALARCGHYLMDENHPLVLIFFLSVMSSSQVLFLSSAFFRLNHVQQVLAIILSSMPHVLTYKTMISTASVITPRNHQHEMRRYPYDHVLYRPGQFCRTCHFLKPARSKHCGICNVCVAKHDHHCIFVMNCLGRGNYVYFVGLMASLGFLLSYGAYLAYMLLNETIQNDTFHRSDDYSSGAYWGKGKTWTQFSYSWAHVFAHDVRIGGVGMLAALTAPLAWGLFCYHIYLIWAGMTTNETSKWADWRDDITDGLAFKAEREPANGTPSQKMTAIEPAVDWPISSIQLLTSSHNGHLPNQQIGSASDSANMSSSKLSKSRLAWSRVRSLDEINNLYDLGFWDNLKDVISK